MMGRYRSRPIILIGYCEHKINGLALWQFELE
jgi:hypothetical protein